MHIGRCILESEYDSFQCQEKLCTERRVMKVSDFVRAVSGWIAICCFPPIYIRLISLQYGNFPFVRLRGSSYNGPPCHDRPDTHSEVIFDKNTSFSIKYGHFSDFKKYSVQAATQCLEKLQKYIILNKIF